MPFERYRIYTNGKDVYAVSTYAGHTVRGKASCAPEDEFCGMKGANLAALRCGLKIADKRIKRAKAKKHEAEVALTQALGHLEDMEFYLSDAEQEKEKLLRELNEILEDMRGA